MAAVTALGKRREEAAAEIRDGGWPPSAPADQATRGGEK
jgi:hypothetical protein